MKRNLVPVLRAVVLAIAAVLSFSALHDLAILCGWGGWQAALFPIMVDAGVGIALLLERRRLALTLLASTVLGNTVAHVLTAYGLKPHWSIVVLVGALAPAVLASTWHLEAQVDTPERVASSNSTLLEAELEVVEEEVQAPEPRDLDVLEVTAAVSIPLEEQVEDAPLPETAGGDDLEERARELVEGGAGRGQLMEKLGLSEHQAKQYARKYKVVAA